MIFDDIWWYLMIFDDIWRYLIIIEDISWYLATTYLHFPQICSLTPGGKIVSNIFITVIQRHQWFQINVEYCKIFITVLNTAKYCLKSCLKWFDPLLTSLLPVGTSLGMVMSASPWHQNSFKLNNSDKSASCLNSIWHYQSSQFTWLVIMSISSSSVTHLRFWWKWFVWPPDWQISSCQSWHVWKVKSLKI